MKLVKDENSGKNYAKNKNKEQEQKNKNNKSWYIDGDDYGFVVVVGVMMMMSV